MSPVYSLARHTFWALGLTAMLTSMALVGCGSKGTDAATAPGVVVPLGPTAVTCTQPGQVPTSFGCLYTYSCTNGTAWLPGEARCVPILPGSTGSITTGTFLAQSLQITSEDTFKLFLQNMGMCSWQPYGMYYIGTSSCSSYTGAAYLVLQAPGATGTTLPAQGTVTLVAGAPAPNTPNQNGLTGGRVLPLSFSSALTVHGGGFSGNGPNDFRFAVSGLPGNSYQMSVDLRYNGVVFARGTMIAR